MIQWCYNDVSLMLRCVSKVHPSVHRTWSIERPSTQRAEGIQSLHSSGTVVIHFCRILLLYVFFDGVTWSTIFTIDDRHEVDEATNVAITPWHTSDHSKPCHTSVINHILSNMRPLCHLRLFKANGTSLPSLSLTHIKLSHLMLSILLAYFPRPTVSSWTCLPPVLMPSPRSSAFHCLLLPLISTDFIPPKCNKAQQTTQMITKGFSLG